jgi:hypothetical protein
MHLLTPQEHKEFKSLSQEEQERKEKQLNFYLGKAPKESSRFEIASSTPQRAPNTLIPAQKHNYLVQKWSDGTPCDVTHQPRQTEVQYHCSPKSTEHIAHIQEVAICRYKLVIYTPFLCQDAAFTPAIVSETREIHCFPNHGFHSQNIWDYTHVPPRSPHSIAHLLSGKKSPDIQNPETLSKLADSLIEKMFGQKGILDYIDLQELKKQGLKEGKRDNIAATIMEAYGKAKAAAESKKKKKEEPVVIVV